LKSDKGFLVLNSFQILRWGLSNLDIFETVADSAYGVAHSESCVEGWGHIKTAGDAVAPKADELIVLTSSRDAGDEEAVRAQLIEAFAERAMPRGNRPPRDGKWLMAGVELLKIVLPILLSRLGS
jgi:hypothetical protein